MAPTEDDLRRKAGVVPRVRGTGDEGEVTLENWMRPPHNRVAYQRVRDIIPTAQVDRGRGEAWWLPGTQGADSPGPALAASQVRRGGACAPDEGDALHGFLLDSHTDAFLVLHRGRLVHEEYRHGMGPATPHLAMSVSKSITATAVGGVIGAGQLSPDDLVTEVVPEFRGTGMEGATVRHVLDMRTGTREEITTLKQQRDYYATARWAPPTPRSQGPHADRDTRTHFWRMEQVRPHGGDFEYRSTLTCVLAMLAERATGLTLPTLMSRYLWHPLGAEHDTELTVDGSGHALADIGVSCTARDLARLGEVLRLEGLRPDGVRVVPAAWVRDTLSPDPGQAEAFPRHGSPYLQTRTAYYRNQWWVAAPRRKGRDGVYLALGIHGQVLFIHEAAEVVIAKFSSWPDPWADHLARRTLNACMGLAEALAAEDSGLPWSVGPTAEGRAPDQGH